MSQRSSRIRSGRGGFQDGRRGGSGAAIRASARTFQRLSEGLSRLSLALSRLLGGRARGVGTVEFALASLLFLPITLGTIDLGRAVYQHSQLTNAVREGARYGKVKPTDTAGIQSRIESYGIGFTLSTFSAVPSTSPCDPGLCRLTVTAGFQFTPITADLVNMLAGGAIPASWEIRSRATVGVE